MRITKKIFTDLAIFMIGFGLTIGIVFPVFTMVIGVPAEYITVPFIIACILAGIIVGVVNIILARMIVGRRLKMLSDKMKYVNQNLENRQDLDAEECYKRCIIEVDSEDEIGHASESFNDLVKAFLSSLTNETSIRNFTEIFTNELDLEKLSEKALGHLIEYTHSTAGMILIDRGGEIEVSASTLIKDSENITNLQIVHKVFTTNERQRFDFPEDITIEAGLVDFRPKAILLEPISYKNEVLGVILLASTKEFTHDSLDNLHTYTHGLSLGMHNAILHNKLEQLAILDPLTKVYNRRFGVERLKEEFGRSVRSNNPLGVLMLDIDHFKQVNDTYGHIIGDQVLINVANILKTNLRKGDILVRYGGEEFIALLPGASTKSIKRVAEKIRRYIEEHTIRHNSQDIKITISIGGTSFPEIECEDTDKLVEIADKALYEAKDTGRNKVVIR